MRFRLMAVCLAVLAAGCASVRSADPAGPTLAAIQAEPWTEEDLLYRLSGGDQLMVRFLVDPDLNTQVTIGPDGRAVLPLVRSLPLAGLTVEEANATVRAAYARVLRQPEVELLVASYGAAQIFVGGEVREPGAKPVRGQLTATQAVMTAGGFLDTARTGKVVVLRKRRDGRVLMRTVDVDGVLEGRRAQDFIVLPGDVVFVPRSAIAEVNRIVRQYVTDALPVNLNYDLNRDRF